GGAGDERPLAPHRQRQRRPQAAALPRRSRPRSSRPRDRCRQVGFQCCFLELAAGDPDTALDGLSRLHAVRLTERLPDSLRLFAWRLGLPAPRDLPHARDSGAGAADVPAEIEAIMADSLAADRTLYRAAEERFARDYAALCAAARGEDRIDAYLD